MVISYQTYVRFTSNVSLVSLCSLIFCWFFSSICLFLLFSQQVTHSLSVNREPWIMDEKFGKSTKSFEQCRKIGEIKDNMEFWAKRSLPAPRLSQGHKATTLSITAPWLLRLYCSNKSRYIYVYIICDIFNHTQFNMYIYNIEIFVKKTTKVGTLNSDFQRIQI